jgi:hypothetical protein
MSAARLAWEWYSLTTDWVVHGFLNLGAEILLVSDLVRIDIRFAKGDGRAMLARPTALSVEYEALNLL